MVRENRSGETRALRLLRVSGMLVLVLAAVLLSTSPKKPVHANVPGFRDVVVGFELASTPDQVFGILGYPQDPDRAATVSAMDLTNKIDFAFMIAYPLFFFAIALLLASRQAVPKWFLPVCALLALTMGVADALENRQLLLLSQTIDPASMASPLARLRLFTALKWSAIAVTSGLVALRLWRDASLWRWSALTFGLSALLSLLAFRDVSWLEAAANLVAVGWLLTWVYALRARAGA